MPAADLESQDLQDVFKLLYGGEEWVEDEEQEEDPPLDWTVPDIELDILDLPIQLPNDRYSKKRILSLLDWTASPKRARIYPTTQPRTNSVPSTQPLPEIPDIDYAPYSPLPLLSRLRSFHSSTYSALLPVELSALQAALHGWNCDSRDKLRCRSCQETLSLDGIADIIDEVVKKEVGRRMAPMLETAHGRSCAWRVKHSPISLYDDLRKLLHPILSTSLTPLAEAIQVECLTDVSGIEWISPLDDAQSQNLSAALQRGFSSPDIVLEKSAVVLAFFGWYPFYPNSLDTKVDLERISRKQDRTETLCCRVCERRLGLWLFRGEKRRTLDAVRDHLDWCPIRGRANSGEGAWWEGCRIVQKRETKLLHGRS